MKRRAGIWRTAAALVLAAAAMAGCASSGTSPRLARYRPDVKTAVRDPWERQSAVRKPAEAPAAAGSVAVPGAHTNEGVRRLRCGDRVSISKLGIPQPDENKDVIDDRGCVNLSFIGTIKLDGLTTSEAERAIEKDYVDKGYYSKITVIVVVQQDEYFVRGEVKLPGKYPLNVGVTLMRAITTAGGYTDFADPRKINVFRGDKVYRYNADKIEALQATDPVILPDDVIVVARKWW
jgi:polysaccharide export outer membrane protein